MYKLVTDNLPDKSNEVYVHFSPCNLSCTTNTDAWLYLIRKFDIYCICQWNSIWHHVTHEENTIFVWSGIYYSACYNSWVIDVHQILFYSWCKCLSILSKLLGGFGFSKKKTRPLIIFNILFSAVIVTAKCSFKSTHCVLYQ